MHKRILVCFFMPHSVDGTNGLSSRKPCAYCWIARSELKPEVVLATTTTIIVITLGILMSTLEFLEHNLGNSREVEWQHCLQYARQLRENLCEKSKRKLLFI